MDIKLRGWNDRDESDATYALGLSDRLEIILTLKDVNDSHRS